MDNPTSTQDPVTQFPVNPQTSPSPLRCLSGALMSGGFATALYFLTASIAQTFAAKPIHSTNITVLNIASAVRTLVVGLSTLATGIFGLVTIGLVALAVQVFIQQLKNPKLPPSKEF